MPTSESIVNAGFTDVDRTGEALGYVRHLDYMSAKRQVQATKQRSFTALELTDGDSVLDVGCGTGDDALALAELVGAGGRVVGVDKSQTMVDEARRRATGRGQPVEYQVGDAYALPFSDASFDRARMDRVLHHLENPERAVAELARVVRPGGRVALFEPDFDTVVIDSPDRATTRTVMNAFCESMRSGRVGRQLFALTKRAGCIDVRVEPITWTSTEFAEVERLLGLDRVVSQAVASGVVDTDQAAAWLAGLRAADAAGCFFWATTAFLVSGRKP